MLAGDVVVERPEVDRGEAWDAAIARAEGIVAAKTGGASPAARKAIELIAGARDADRDAGFAAEDDALEAMSRTPELIASMYSFDLVQKRAKRPAGAPDRSLARPVTKVGIVGAGLMASQLALLFVRRLKVPVVLTDLDQERADKGVAYVHAELDKLLAKGRSNQDKTNRLKALVTGADRDQTDHPFEDADFVIEAVFEEMSVKKQVFADVEKFVSPECVLATNTSSLSITEMAADLEHPERVVGFHFFNPVAVMPLLEIVRGERTDDADAGHRLRHRQGAEKTTILVKDSPSFIVNRLLGRFMGEVAQDRRRGHADPGRRLRVRRCRADAAVRPAVPRGPGHRAAQQRDAVRRLPGPLLRLARTSGAWSRLASRAYYGADGAIDPSVAELLEQPSSPIVKTAEEVREQTLSALADEARRMLDEGVVAAPEDLDLAMITGAGFSFWNGGLTMLLDIAGISEKVNGKRFH